MIIKSEKESYRDEFREIVRTKDEDVFLWGEELLDKKLVLYSGKIKEMSEYETFSDCLINCGLIVLNLQKGKVLKCITTRMNPGNNRIYIQDDAFNASVYKKANIDRKLFSKIRCNEDYKPKKKTAVALAIALELDIDDMKDLLARAEIALSPSNKFDLIIEYFISHKEYNVYKINLALFQHKQPILGE